MSGAKRYLDEIEEIGRRQRSTAARRRIEGDLRTPEIILGERLAEIRTRQGLTAEQLAERVAELGGPRLDRATISRVEGGRRGVSLNEALIFAAALGVAPVNLFIPTADTEYVPVHLTPELEAGATAFRDWVRGDGQLPGLDEKPFVMEVPDSEWQAQSGKLDAARDDVFAAERRLRIAHAKADLIGEQMNQLGATTLDLTSNSGVGMMYQRLDARLDVAYDRIAEAKVTLDDAQTKYQLMLAHPAYQRRVPRPATPEELMTEVTQVRQLRDSFDARLQGLTEQLAVVRDAERKEEDDGER